MQYLIKGSYGNVNINGKYYQYGIKPEAIPDTAPRQTIQYKEPLTRPHPQQHLNYYTVQEIYNTIKDYTEDPEILEEVLENMKDFYKPIPIKINIFDNEIFKQEAQEIENLFTEIFTEEETAGLEETTIIPEQYNYFFTALFKKYLENQTFLEIKQDNNTLIFKDILKTKTELEYYILNDIKDSTTEAIKDVIYNLFVEDEEIKEEVKEFIYLNSYYMD